MKKIFFVLIIILTACTVFASMYGEIELGFVTTSVGIGSNNGSTDASISVGFLPLNGIESEIFTDDMNLSEMPFILEQSLLFNLAKGSEHFTLWVGFDAIELTTIQFNNVYLLIGGTTKLDYNFNGKSSIFLKSRLPVGIGRSDFNSIRLDFLPYSYAFLIMGITTTLGYSFSF